MERRAIKSLSNNKSIVIKEGRQRRGDCDHECRILQTKNIRYVK